MGFGPGVILWYSLSDGKGSLGLVHGTKWDWAGGAWTGLIWLRIGTDDRLL